MSDETDIFQLRAGFRYSITTEVINIGDGKREFNVTYTAVATNKIRYCFGALRRLFVDADREFYPGERSIWLSGKPKEPNVSVMIEGVRKVEDYEEKRADEKLVQQYAPAG